MSIHVALHHRTHYTYDRLVSHAPHVVRLRPAPHCRTPILSYSLKVLPKSHFINWQQDPQGNYRARLVFPEKSTELLIEVDLVAEMSVFNPFDFFLEPGAERFPFEYDHVLDHELAPFQLKLPPTPRFADYLERVAQELLGQARDGRAAAGRTPASPLSEDSRPRTIDFLVDLNRRLWQDTKYIIRLEPGVQTPEETLSLRSGSCRDSAWLLCQLCRHLGLAARFVSGYLIQLTPDVKSLDGPSGPAADFTDLHAWCEVYLPGAGWIGLDPTSGLLAGEGHIPLACSPDPTSAAPVTGAVDECKAKLVHEMRVTRIYESPRVTKPYTEEQWQAIETLGHRIDAELQQGDVRLTMGGEPTFVSIDDMDGAEWNVAAQGPKKRELAGTLLKRLKRQFAPGGLLHYGQGKWYPGESLPRWALGCYWRKDGEPLWHNDALIADESRNYGHGTKEAERLARRIIDALGVEARWLLPAYEDVWYYLWKERRLPANVDPLQSNLKDKEERDRLARVFQRGLSAIVGYVLPLQRRWFGSQPGWASGPWFLRDETLFLLPGDSPIGYRLPLDSLPWVSETDYPWLHPPDPMQALPPLPKRDEIRQRYLTGSPSPSPRPSPQGRGGIVSGLESKPGAPGSFTAGSAGSLSPRERTGVKGTELSDDAILTPAAQQSASWIVRTALCVEPRHGRLHVFMPPVETTEDYLELVAGIEEAATDLDQPIILEGEPPPRDPRLNVIKVTPDPGVIEVNLQPAHNWDELVHNTTTLYEEARQSRLGTEKFMLDGRHVGTGGGNHIVIGGPTPADSPILRRPDLLRSLLAYWHNHPSLSYLFSSLFLGPTSQHPRLDEARNDVLYELEIAFRQVEREMGVNPPHPPFGHPLPLRGGEGRGEGAAAYGTCPPWLVDRVFRHLLADVTGNTHRSEFSIDKLYSPDTAGGRQGLVELRSFEMPPHARMSLAQHLLLRGLLARFWKSPYRQPLVRWGTELHDRFMLPHFVEQDFEDVITDLREAGYPLETTWFAPHMEFRFPLYGAITQRGVNLEIRQALEPWHVLGEEPGPGGTVRYVDSSVERLQVKVRGLTNTRHVIACNGRRVPLHPTGTVGEFVAGVRYRAWQPPNCLHPTIPVHTPLVFDIVDLWNRRSLGGCTYHVAHPGGRNYEQFPVNAYEAESRRLARFFHFGHSPGPLDVPPEERNAEFPFTLDLRRG
jgi:uncharacterized protein (DUF2126 family)